MSRTTKQNQQEDLDKAKPTRHNRHRTPDPATKESVLLSNAHATSSRKNHVLGHKISLKKGLKPHKAYSLTTTE